MSRDSRIGHAMLIPVPQDVQTGTVWLPLASSTPGDESMEGRRKQGESSSTGSQSERVETPHDRALREGGEVLSLHRWTDAELKQRAADLGITNARSLSRLQLIEQLENAG
jgi:hypothetical protein